MSFDFAVTDDRCGFSVLTQILGGRLIPKRPGKMRRGWISIIDRQSQAHVHRVVKSSIRLRCNSQVDILVAVGEFGAMCPGYLRLRPGSVKKHAFPARPV